MNLMYSIKIVKSCFTYIVQVRIQSHLLFAYMYEAYQLISLYAKLLQCNCLI